MSLASTIVLGFSWQEYRAQKEELEDLDLLITRAQKSRRSNMATAERLLVDYQECLDEKRKLSEK